MNFALWAGVYQKSWTLAGNNVRVILPQPSGTDGWSTSTVCGDAPELGHVESPVGLSLLGVPL